jgi:2-polyprenyl-3-methyl-5-hydroxy-6-metoxy-1,4-benzoquinol methylase
MKRQFNPAAPEWMDRPQPVSPELERDLANLRSLNRWFGSHRLIRHFLPRWLNRNTTVRILDLATGSGDIPGLIVDWARSQGVSVTIDAIDQQPSTIAIAKRLNLDRPEINFVSASLFDWNPKEPYDLVLCSLALHHFSDEDAVEILQRCRELSRGAVLVADLRRAHWLSAAIYLLTALVYSERMTRNDGRVSAARAFSFGELHKLAGRAGWKNFGHQRFAIGRQAIWLDSR